MQMTTDEITKEFQLRLADGTFVKAQLVLRTQADALTSLQIRPVLIKEEKKLNFRFRYLTKDVVKNYTIEAATTVFANFVTEHDLRSVQIFTLKKDVEFRWNKKRILKMRQLKATHTSPLPLTHDRQKKRKLNPKNPAYLHKLDITDKSGKVYKKAQSKYRQINHYIEILSSMLEKLPDNKALKILDMGSGKGYLTFALYDYLTNSLQKEAHITGIEHRAELVDFCTSIAHKAQFEHLNFVQAMIEEYETEAMDILIALHACDTATDAAIAKGIRGEAQLVVVAPCCHKQIRREIETHQASNQLDFLTQYGIFLERQAEMITDGIRALLLNYHGYSTKVLEFVSDSHTPKNVLIAATKDKPLTPTGQQRIMKEIQELKRYFGIEYHQLERLLEK